MRTATSSAILSLLLLLHPGIAVSQHGGVFDDTSPVNSYSADDAIGDYKPVLATDGQGHHVVVWAVGLCNPFVAFSGDDGVSWSAPILLKNNVGLDDGYEDWRLALATDAQGTWVTVWQSSDTLGGTLDHDRDLFFVRSTDGGRSWSDPAPITTTDHDDAKNPSLATDGQGTWIAVWEYDGITYSRSTDGGVTWAAPVTLLTGYSHDVPKIATDRSGTWVIIWDTSVDLGGVGTDEDIFFARSTDGGQSWSEPLPVNANAVGPHQTDREPEIAVDEDGAWVVAWITFNGLGGTLGNDYDILFARSTDGAVTWTHPAPLNSDAATDGPGDYDFQPSLQVDERGNWLAAWMTKREDLYDIVGASSSDGGATWTNVAPMHAANGEAKDFHPTLAADGLANWVVVWESEDTSSGDNGEDQDIHSNRLRLPFGTTCAEDADRDGFGSPGAEACPLGETPDCDDDDLRVAPGAAQSCDGINNDCSHPSWPELSLTNESDDDGDGLTECAGDCNDADPLSWAMPGEVSDLTLGRDETGQTELQWGPPDPPGGAPTALVFDVLRAPAPFKCWRLTDTYPLGPQVCLETDGLDHIAADAQDPPVGQVFFYQVRAENACAGTGTLGMPAGTRLRQARDCS